MIMNRMSKFALILIAVLIFISVMLSNAAYAQTPLHDILSLSDNQKEEGATYQQMIDESKESLLKVDKEIRTSKKVHEAPYEYVTERVSLLEKLKRTYVQKQVILERLRDLDNAKDVREDLLDYRKENGTYDFMSVNSYQDKLFNLNSKLENARYELGNIQNKLISAKEKYEKDEKERRRLKDMLNASGDAASSLQLNRKYGLAELKSEISREEASLYKLRRQFIETEMKRNGERAELLKDFLSVALEDVNFSKKDLKGLQKPLRRNLKKLKDKYAEVVEQSRYVKRRMDDLHDAGSSSRRSSHFDAKLDILQFEYDYVYNQMLILRNQIELTSEMIAVWLNVHDLFNDKISNSKLESVADSIEERLDILRAERQLQIDGIADLRSSMSSLRARTGTGSPDIKANRKMIRFNNNLIALKGDYLINQSAAHFAQMRILVQAFRTFA